MTGLTFSINPYYRDDCHPVSFLFAARQSRFAAEQYLCELLARPALHAWIDADLNVQIDDTEQWIAFGKIAAQANSSGGWGAEKMTKYFNPVVLALIDLLKRAMPDCDEETIFWGYHFVSGAMTHNMARTGRLDELSHGLCSSDDFV